MLAIMDDLSIDKITDKLNGINNSGDVPEDLSRIMFLPKQPFERNQVQHHRTISLMRHITKLTSDSDE